MWESLKRRLGSGVYGGYHIFAGNRALWIPFAMIGSTMIEIVLFFILTVRDWCKKVKGLIMKYACYIAEVLKDAQEKKYGVGLFNMANLEMTKSCLFYDTYG